MRLERKCRLAPHRLLKKVGNPHYAYKEVAKLLTERCGFRFDELKEILYEHDKSVKPEEITRSLRAETTTNSFTIQIDCRFKAVAKQLSKKQLEKFEGLETIGNLEYWIKGRIRGKPRKGIIQQISKKFGKTKNEELERILEKTRRVIQKLDSGLQAYFKTF